jgi:methylenetetrahydrofolate dehydrogenase (NADP+)/methenyltetrahydrofolate cyclohydrolase
MARTLSFSYPISLMKSLKAQPYIDLVLPKLKQDTELLKSRGITPKMKVVLVGDNPVSLVYIHQKQKYCEKIGALFELVQLPSSVNEKDFIDCINQINNDDSVHGFLIQLPVPNQLKHISMGDLVNPKKDVDGFNFQNTRDLYLNKISSKTLIPCTPKGIVSLLKFYNYEVEGKNILIIGRSLIVGKPLGLYLNALNATVTIAHSQTNNLESHTKNADIIIVAAGSTHLLKKHHLKADKSQIIIDVGLTKLNDQISGDVHPEVANYVSAITPVPGGVGPMTVISLIENLITAAKNKGSI